jgi:hypothetical protein
MMTATSLVSTIQQTSCTNTNTSIASPMDMKQDLTLRGIKLLDIGYIIIIYFAIGFACAILLDTVLGKYDKVKAENKWTVQLIAEVLGLMWCIGVATYIVRNIVEVIPFPFDGYMGYQHLRLKELGSASMFTFVVMFYSFNLRERLIHVYERIMS